jgi:hypothetical protein
VDLGSVPQERRENLMSVLDKHSHMWAPSKLSEIHGAVHRMYTTGNPVHQSPYRAGPEVREIVRKEIEIMLEK